MENFVVSARKYRPATFDTVVGQEHITITLKNAIRSRQLSSAFLFCGPRGVGKTTCARILAKTINCEALTPVGEACNECESCVSFNQNASFNIHELDAASNNSVDDIRNLIDQVRYPPQSGKYKIYIIDEVHMLSAAAFNAFLKTLEEPPSYAIFILATTEKHKILPTILSRCQIFDFNRIQPQHIAGHLARIAEKEGITAEPEALDLLAQKADGGLRDALSMFDLNVTFSNDRTIRYREVLDNLHILDYEYYIKLTDQLLQADLAQTLLTLDEILRKGFDGHQFVVGLCRHFRDLLVSKDMATVQLLQVTDSVRRQYVEQSTRTPMSFLLSALSLGGQCDMNYKQAKDQRLHIELWLMKLANLRHVLDWQQMPTSLPAAPSETPVVPVTESAEKPEKKKKPESGQSLNPVTAETPTFTADPPSAYQTPTLTGSPAAAPATPASTKLRTTHGIGKPEKKKADSAVNERQNLPDKPLTFDDVQAAWQAFAQLRQNLPEKSVPEQIMLGLPIELTGTTITLRLDNKLQVEYLNDLKQELMSFLRERLQNSQLQLETVISAAPVQKILYSPQDKLNHMTAKNPHLQNLMQELKLEVDY